MTPSPLKRLLHSSPTVSVCSLRPLKFDELIPTTTPAPVEAHAPDVGGRILVLKPEYFHMMLRGDKVYEIRHLRLSPGVWHVGHSGQIYGVLSLGTGVKIETEDQWRAMQPQHRHPDTSRPYKQTWALPVSNPRMFQRPIGYVHHKGSVGTSKYEPVVAKAAVVDNGDDQDMEVGEAEVVAVDSGEHAPESAAERLALKRRSAKDTSGTSTKSSKRRKADNAAASFFEEEAFVSDDSSPSGDADDEASDVDEYGNLDGLIDDSADAIRNNSDVGFYQAFALRSQNEHGESDDGDPFGNEYIEDADVARFQGPAEQDLPLFLADTSAKEDDGAQQRGPVQKRKNTDKVRVHDKGKSRHGGS